MEPMPIDTEQKLREELSQALTRAEAAEAELAELRVAADCAAMGPGHAEPFGPWTLAMRCADWTSEQVLDAYLRRSCQHSSPDHELRILRMELRHRLHRFDQIRKAFREGQVVLTAPEVEATTGEHEKELHQP